MWLELLSSAKKVKKMGSGGEFLLPASAQGLDKAGWWSSSLPGEELTHGCRAVQTHRITPVITSKIITT